MDNEQMRNLQTQGFIILRNVFGSNELGKVQDVLTRYHESWKIRNKAFYEERAINSAYLTHRSHMSTQDRFTLFSFISNTNLLSIVRNIIPKPAFFNTQLFFDPYNTGQANYWHRDIQYGLSESEQKTLLNHTDLMPHFRIPMRDEDGLELIPGSHSRWDTAEEYKVRTEADGARSSDALPDSQVISLQRGDLLIFSAMMLHRGLYGGNRMAFDVLYTDASSKHLQDLDPSCLPEPALLTTLKKPSVFERSLTAKAHSESTPRPSQQS